MDLAWRLSIVIKEASTKDALGALFSIEKAIWVYTTYVGNSYHGPYSKKCEFSFL